MPVFSQSIVIELNDGTKINELISLVQTFSYENGNLLFKQKNSNIDSYDLKSIRKITFGDLTPVSGISSINSSSLSVYPNPVQDLLRIETLKDEKTRVTIFKLDGTIIRKQVLISGNNIIDVSNLKNGFYLIRVNESTTKFIKL